MKTKNILHLFVLIIMIIAITSCKDKKVEPVQQKDTSEVFDIKYVNIPSDNIVIHDNVDVYKDTEKKNILTQVKIFTPVTIVEQSGDLAKVELEGKTISGWISKQDINIVPENWYQFDRLKGIIVYLPKKIEEYKIDQFDKDNYLSYRLYDEKDRIFIFITKKRGSFEESIKYFLEDDKRLGGGTVYFYFKMNSYVSVYYKFLDVGYLTYSYSRQIKINESLYYDITVATPVDMDEKRSNIIEYYDDLSKRILFTVKVIRLKTNLL